MEGESLESRIKAVFADTSLSNAEKMLRVRELHSQASEAAAKKLKITEHEETKQTFVRRYGREEPSYPASLAAVLEHEEAVECLREVCDIRLGRGLWKSATDANDDFYCQLWGDNEVIRFAAQGSGSIFGLLVGAEIRTPEQLDFETPVVHIDSEGSATRVAWNLPAFWKVVVWLGSHLGDAIRGAGSSALGEDDPGADDIAQRQVDLKQRITTWRQSAEPGPTPEEVALLRRVLKVDQVLSTDQAVEAIFACDFAAPRFRPKSQDDE